MATIYLVTSGQYSSYHIEAAYSTRELADAHVARVNGPDAECRPYDYAEVDEYEIDPSPEEGEVYAFVASGSEPPEPSVGQPYPEVRWRQWLYGSEHNVHHSHRQQWGGSLTWYVTVRADTAEKARLLWHDIVRAIRAGTIVPEHSNG